MDPEPAIVRKLAKNITLIKRQVSASFDPIVDFLIEKEVVSLDIKQEIDAISKPSAKVDFLIQIVRHKGHTACGDFLKAMERNGLSDLADTIRKTAVPTAKSTKYTADSTHTGTKGSKRTVGDGMEKPADYVPPLRLSDVHGDSTVVSDRTTFDMESRFRELAIENKTFRENMEHQWRGELNDLRKEKDVLQMEKESMKVERRRMRRENETLREANRDLNDKFIALEGEFRKLKEASDKKIARKDRQIEHLKTQNRQLQEDFDNFKQLVCADNSQLLHDIEDKSARLNHMRRSINNESDRFKVPQASDKIDQTPVLPPIGQSSKQRRAPSEVTSSSKHWKPTHR